MATVLDQLVTVLEFKLEGSGLKKAAKGLGLLKKRAEKTTDSFDRLRKFAIRSAGAMAAALGARAVASKIVEVNKTFQTLRASLKTVTGSAEAAGIAFKGIRKFARETPFTVKQVTNAFVKLKALGLDPSEAALRSYGNTASATGKSMMDFIEAVADAATGEFERLKEFGIRASSQGDQVAFTFQGVTTTVGKNAREIEEYLQSIGNNQFGGAMAEQMKTLGGAFSNLEDSFDSLFLAIGEGGLNEAILEAAAALSEMTAESEGVGEMVGKFLGEMVRSGTKAVRELFASLRRLSMSDVRSFLDGVGLTLKKLLDVLVFVIKHWDSFLAILVGAKLQQGFSAAISGLRSMGVAASASLGPIGAIAAALVALIPIAMDAGEALGDVLAKKKGIAREDKKKSRENLSNILEVGQAGPEGAEIASARAAASARLNAAEQDVERLSAEGMLYVPGARKELKAAQARSREARAEMRALDKRAKGVLKSKREADAARARLKAIQGGRVERDMKATTAQMLREDEDALRKSLRGSNKVRKKAFAAGQKVLRSGGTLEDAQTAAREVRAESRGRGGRKKAKDEVKSEATRKIESRIEELVRQTELSTFLKRTDLRGAERDAASLAAGQARKKELQAAVSEGRLSALGGEFSQSGTTQLLRDAGILGDTQNATPPVLTVTIVKADVQVDAPIKMHVKEAAASPKDLAASFRSTVKTVLRDELGAAIESIKPGTRR